MVPALGNSTRALCADSPMNHSDYKETRQTSKEQTKIKTFILEGPQPCTIFCFVLATLGVITGHVTNCWKRPIRSQLRGHHADVLSLFGSS